MAAKKKGLLARLKSHFANDGAKAGVAIGAVLGGLVIGVPVALVTLGIFVIPSLAGGAALGAAVGATIGGFSGGEDLLQQQAEEVKETKTEEEQKQQTDRLANPKGVTPVKGQSVANQESVEKQLTQAMLGQEIKQLSSELKQQLAKIKTRQELDSFGREVTKKTNEISTKIKESNIDNKKELTKRVNDINNDVGQATVAKLSELVKEQFKQDPPKQTVEKLNQRLNQVEQEHNASINKASTKKTISSAGDFAEAAVSRVQSDIKKANIPADEQSKLIDTSYSIIDRFGEAVKTKLQSVAEKSVRVSVKIARKSSRVEVNKEGGDENKPPKQNTSKNIAKTALKASQVVSANDLVKGETGSKTIAGATGEVTSNESTATFKAGGGGGATGGSR